MGPPTLSGTGNNAEGATHAAAGPRRTCSECAKAGLATSIDAKISIETRTALPPTDWRHCDEGRHRFQVALTFCRKRINSADATGLGAPPLRFLHPRSRNSRSERADVPASVTNHRQCDRRLELVARSNANQSRPRVREPSARRNEETSRGQSHSSGNVVEEVIVQTVYRKTRFSSRIWDIALADYCR